jgi:tetratricopeptide (TPR) repeat protein
VASLDAFFQKAVAAHERGDVATARTNFEKLAPHHGTYYARAAGYLASYAEEEGDLDLAEELLRRAIQAWPHADALYRLGDILFQQRRMAEAEPLFRQTLQMDAKFTDAYIRLGMILKDRGAVPEAIRSFEYAILNDTRAVAARYYLAQMCLRTGDQKRALGQLYFVLKIQPDYKPAHLLMADVFQSMGDHRQALVEYCHVVNLGTEDAQVFRRMARSFQAIGDRPQALRANERAFFLDPSLGACGLDAAREHEDMGHDERALAIYQRLMQLDEFRAAAQAAINRLDAKRASFDLGGPAPSDPEPNAFEAPPVQTASGTAPMRQAAFNTNELATRRAAQTDLIFVDYKEPPAPSALESFLKGMTDTIRRYVPEETLETVKDGIETVKGRVEQLDSLRQRIDWQSLRRRFGASDEPR